MANGKGGLLALFVFRGGTMEIIRICNKSKCDECAGKPRLVYSEYTVNVHIADFSVCLCEHHLLKLKKLIGKVAEDSNIKEIKY